LSAASELFILANFSSVRAAETRRPDVPCLRFPRSSDGPVGEQIPFQPSESLGGSACRANFQWFQGKTRGGGRGLPRCCALVTLRARCHPSVSAQTAAISDACRRYIRISSFWSAARCLRDLCIVWLARSFVCERNRESADISKNSRGNNGGRRSGQRTTTFSELENA